MTSRSGETRISDETLKGLIEWIDRRDTHTTEKLLSRALRELVETRREGWVMVPRELTQAMLDAGTDEHNKRDTIESDLAAIYRAMLTAAPTPQEGT